MSHERMNDLPKKVCAVSKFEFGKIIVCVIDVISLLITLQSSEIKPIETAFLSLIPAFYLNFAPDIFSMLQKIQNHLQSSTYQNIVEYVQLSKSYETERVLKLALNQCQNVSFEKI